MLLTKSNDKYIVVIEDKDVDSNSVASRICSCPIDILIFTKKAYSDENLRLSCIPAMIARNGTLMIV